MQGIPRRRAHKPGRDTRPHPLAHACESLEVRRLLATITFDTVTRTLTVQTGSGNDDVFIEYDGGTRDVTLSDDVAGTFDNVRRLNVRTGDGDDDVRFITHFRVSRNFTLDVDCGAGRDEFVGGPGVNDIINGAVFDVRVAMGDGFDNIVASAGTLDNPCNITAGSRLEWQLFGGTVLGLGSDEDVLSVSHRGEVDGTLLMNGATDRGDDLLFATINILAGSTGSVGTANVPARINGGGESDELTYRVTDNSNGGADVFARMDGGFSLFDHDVGTHTANVVATGLEAESIVTAFRDRSITQHARAGDPVVLSGVVFEPNAGQSFFLDVDWGDGTTETFEFAPGTFTSGVSRLELSHAYERQGKYDVQLQWRDDLAFGNSDVLSVQVLPKKGPKK